MLKEGRILAQGTYNELMQDEESEFFKLLSEYGTSEHEAETDQDHATADASSIPLLYSLVVAFIVHFDFSF